MINFNAVVTTSLSASNFSSSTSNFSWNHVSMQEGAKSNMKNLEMCVTVASPCASLGLHDVRNLPKPHVLQFTHPLHTFYTLVHTKSEVKQEE